LVGESFKNLGKTLNLMHFAPIGGWNLAKTLGTYQKIIKKIIKKIINCIHKNIINKSLKKIF
jgi:hypothetical protein